MGFSLFGVFNGFFSGCGYHGDGRNIINGTHTIEYLPSIYGFWVHRNWGDDNGDGFHFLIILSLELIILSMMPPALITLLNLTFFLQFNYFTSLPCHYPCY